MAKASSKTKQKAKSKNNLQEERTTQQPNMSRTVLYCYSCCSWLQNPCRRLSHYVSKKLKVLQYAKALCRVAFDFLTAESTFRSGLLFIIIGLFLSIISEMFALSPRYNTVVLLTIMVAARFPNFPVGTMRPQVNMIYGFVFPTHNSIYTLLFC